MALAITGFMLTFSTRKVDDRAMAAAARKVCASTGNRSTEDPNLLGPGVCEVSAYPVGTGETLTRGTADEEDKGGSGEAVQVALKDVVVEEPLDGTVGDVEELVRVVNEVLEKDVATAGVVLDEHSKVVEREVRQSGET